jgi:alcohol dehydrogenase class IV
VFGDLTGKKRAFIVTDKPLFDMGLLKEVNLSLGDWKSQLQKPSPPARTNALINSFVGEAFP